MAHSRLAASGKINRKGNIRNTKNLPASGRLRAIFAERYRQPKQKTLKHSIYIILLLILSQCYHTIGYTQQVEKREQYNYYYKHLKNGKVCKLFPRKDLVGHFLYDTIGRIIERVNLGDYCKFENDSSLIPRHIYDSENHTTKSIFYYANDSIVDSIHLWQFYNQKKIYLISKMIYEHDSNGNLVSRTKLKYDNSIWFKVKYIKTNNYSKHPISLSYIENLRKMQSSGKDYGTLVFVDSLNRTIENLDYYPTGFNYLSITYYSNYSKNIETNLTYFDNMRNLVDIEKTFRNTKKQIVKKTYSSANNDFEYVDIYLYDKRDLLKRKKHFENGKLTSVTKFKYQFHKD